MIGLPDSFLKQYNEKHSPHTLFGVISSSIQSGADWATALLNWAKRKEITINGASKTATFTDDFATDIKRGLLRICQNASKIMGDGSKVDPRSTQMNIDKGTIMLTMPSFR